MTSSLVPAEPSTDVPSTPAKKRQCTLFEAMSGEKRPRTTETLQDSSHKKLRSKLSGQSLVAFEEQLKQVRELEATVEMQRAAKRAIRESSTQLVDPMLRGRGVTMGLKKMGRPKGSSRADNGKRHKRTFAGPVLRRDPTAQEKLSMIMYCEQLAKDQGFEAIKLLRGQDRKKRTWSQ